ncbi:efflux RND transporter permease subunit [Myxococcota bacterium]|nr:efflux RND transporter permease subunit [Myxococcota bacterium]
MRWAQWIVDHTVTVVIFVFMITVFGAWSYITLPREAAPDIKIPVVLVSTPYIGVSPEDIESLVTVPLERELKGIKDIKTMTSTSYEGTSLITLEFNPDADISEALQKVRERVDAAKPDLPEDAEDTMVAEISFSDFPILLISISGPQDEEVLKQRAEDLQDVIEGLPGVLEVSLSGGLTREVRVLADPDRLERFDVSFNDLTMALRNENVNIPSGNVDAGRGDYLLRVPAELATADDLRGVPVKNVGDRTVFIGDVARVVDGYAERSTISRQNGEPTITLGVKKRAGENLIELADAAKAATITAAETWPEGMRYSFQADASRDIDNSVAELENNILSGLLLVVGVLFFFMGFRNSWFVALAIPTSMLISFMVLDFMGVTLNMIVLFALILALGMLVDNAIVVVENIYRHVEEGKTPKEASVLGVSEMAVPVTTSTLTTHLAFAPLLAWEGIMGEFMGYMPLTVIIVLTASLFVALVIVPVATATLMKAPKTARTEGELPPENELMGKILRAYRSILGWSIDHRYISLAGGFLSLIVTFVLYGFLNHGTEFFPLTEPNQVTVALRAPDGTRLETTDRMLRQLEAAISTETDVRTVIAETGSGGGGGGFGGGAGTPNVGNLTLVYHPIASDLREGETPRAGSSFDSIERVRGAAEQLVGASVTVEAQEMGPPVGKPVEVKLIGEDYDKLGELAEEVKRGLAEVKGVVDLSDDYRVGRPELRFTVDRAAAKRVGASSSMVANTLRGAVSGTKATVLRDGEDETDVIVALDAPFVDDAEAILRLRVPGKDNLMVPLSTLASYEALGGSGAIKHDDRRRVITISGDVADGFNVNEVQGAVKKLIGDWKAPAGIELTMGGADQKQQEATAFLARTFLIACVLIFLVLVTQFDSIVRPFIIMVSVLLSLIGVLWGLIITGTPFGIIMTGIGVISLAGVVVNNAIVLLDYVQVLREKGVGVRDALIQAGLTRFRPVILTALTTLLGLIPMATGVTLDFRKLAVTFGGASAAFWGPMAIAVIFGLGVATVLTLVMVPTMYTISEDLSDLARRLFGGRAKKATPAVVTASLALLLIGGEAQAQALSLAQVVTETEKNNLDLQLIEEQTFQAKNQVGTAWTLLSPKVQANANYTINKQAVELNFADSIPEEFADFFDADSVEPTVIQAKRYADMNVSVVQPLFSPESLPLLRGAYTMRDAAYAQEADIRLQVRAGAAQAYYGLAVARQAVEITRQAHENAEAHYALAKRQVAAGAAPPLAELQAELAVSRAERSRRQAEESLTTAEQAFAMLTGLPASTQVTLPSPQPAPAGTVEEALSQAKSQRPDLQVAELQAKAAQLQVQAEAMGWLPDVSARYTYSLTQNLGFQGEPDWWMVVLNATWTPWDGGYRITTQRDAASNARAAQLMQEKALLEVEQEIRVAWSAFERAEASLVSVERELNLARESLRLAELGFQAGSVSGLDADDARLGLEATELTLLTERMNRDLAAIRLAVAMGAWTP